MLGEMLLSLVRSVGHPFREAVVIEFQGQRISRALFRCPVYCVGNVAEHGVTVIALKPYFDSRMSERGREDHIHIDD